MFPSDNYWNDQRLLMFNILFPQIRDAIISGAISGMDMLGNIQLGLDFAIINQWAEDFARTYTYELVRDIDALTQSLLRAKIDNWVQSGAPLDELMMELDEVYGSYRSFMIATTEVTRAFGEGNIQLWRASGIVEEVEWMTAMDEVVCDICGALDGTRVQLGEAGWEGYSPNEEPNMVGNPPAHVNCRCWMRPIVRSNG